VQVGSCFAAVHGSLKVSNEWPLLVRQVGDGRVMEGPALFDAFTCYNSWCGNMMGDWNACELVALAVDASRCICLSLV
jgi:hypothetical protein